VRLLTAVALLLAVGCEGETEREPRSAVAEEMALRVRRQLREGGRARVLVNLAPGRRDVRDAQQRVIDAAGEDLRLLYRYDNVPALAGELGPRGLERLLADPLVASVQIDEPGHGHLAQCVPALGADTVHAAYGWTGKKIRVAVIDSGIDTDHPDLADDLVAQQCFSGDCPPGGTATGPSAEDDFGHGTAVSGIITSKGTVSAVGVAPDAEIVAVRVLDAQNTGGPSQWIAGLDWVLTNLATLKVQVVNLSLGTWTPYVGTCDAQQPALADVITKLVAKGVVVFASAGNKGSSTGVDAPACISGVIAVGATYDSNMGRQPPTGTYPTGCFDATTGPDVIACFTNSGPALDLLAPSYDAETTALGGGHIEGFSGTSAATPYAVGAAALLLEADPTLTPDEAREILTTETDHFSTDPKNRLSFPVVDAFRAVQAVGEDCECTKDADCDDGDDITEDICDGCVCAHPPQDAADAGGGGDSGSDSGSCGCAAVGRTSRRDRTLFGWVAGLLSLVP